MHFKESKNLKILWAVRSTFKAAGREHNIVAFLFIKR